MSKLKRIIWILLNQRYDKVFFGFTVWCDDIGTQNLQIHFMCVSLTLPSDRISPHSYRKFNNMRFILNSCSMSHICSRPAVTYYGCKYYIIWPGEKYRPDVKYIFTSSHIRHSCIWTAKYFHHFKQSSLGSYRNAAPYATHTQCKEGCWVVAPVPCKYWLFGSEPAHTSIFSATFWAIIQKHAQNHRP